MARPVKASDKDITLIKQIMREKDINLDTMAERMGKTKSTISNLLGRGNMTISTLVEMAKALEVEVSDLFPVPQGYVHYMEAKNIAMGIRQEQPQAAVADKDVALFEKFKAFMAQEQGQDESLLVNNPAFMQ